MILREVRIQDFIDKGSILSDSDIVFERFLVFLLDKIKTSTYSKLSQQTFETRNVPIVLESGEIEIDITQAQRSIVEGLRIVKTHSGYSIATGSSVYTDKIPTDTLLSYIEYGSSNFPPQPFLMNLLNYIDANKKVLFQAFLSGSMFK